MSWGDRKLVLLWLFTFFDEERRNKKRIFQTEK